MRAERFIPIDRQGATAIVFSSRSARISEFVVLITVRGVGAEFLVVA